MTWDERIRYLLRAASRAEEQGDSRVAELFRRRAAEMTPAEVAIRVSRLTSGLERP